MDQERGGLNPYFCAFYYHLSASNHVEFFHKCFLQETKAATVFLDIELTFSLFLVIYELQFLTN